MASTTALISPTSLPTSVVRRRHARVCVCVCVCCKSQRAAVLRVCLRSTMKNSDVLCLLRFANYFILFVVLSQLNYDDII